MRHLCFAAALALTATSSQAQNLKLNLGALGLSPEGATGLAGKEGNQIGIRLNLGAKQDGEAYKRPDLPGYLFSLDVRRLLAEGDCYLKPAGLTRDKLISDVSLAIRSLLPQKDQFAADGAYQRDVFALQALQGALGRGVPGRSDCNSARAGGVVSATASNPPAVPVRIAPKPVWPMYPAVAPDIRYPVVHEDEAVRIPGQYIVRFRDGLALSRMGRIPNRAEIAAALGLEEGAIRTHFWPLAPAALVTLTRAQLATVQMTGLADAVFQDRRGFLTQRMPAGGLDRIDSPTLTADSSFKPLPESEIVRVYVIDSGIKGDHTVFADPPILHRRIARDTGGMALLGCETHGTQMASKIVGKLGVARNVELVDVNIVPCNEEDAGSGDFDASAILEAFRWIYFAEGEFPEKRPFVVNMSLTVPMQDISQSEAATWKEFIQNFIESYPNAILVASAGNIGAGMSRAACDYFPGNVSRVVTVGAVTFEGIKEAYSADGDCVDTWAYGSGLVVAQLEGNEPAVVDETGGTSHAAALVSGIAAHGLARGLKAEEVLTGMLRVDQASGAQPNIARTTIALDPNCRVVTNTGDLRVRAAPNGSARRVAALAKGSEVRSLAQKDGWTKVVATNGQIGWSSARWLDCIQ